MIPLFSCYVHDLKLKFNEAHLSGVHHGLRFECAIDHEPIWMLLWYKQAIAWTKCLEWRHPKYCCFEVWCTVHVLPWWSTAAGYGKWLDFPRMNQAKCWTLNLASCLDFVFSTTKSTAFIIVRMRLNQLHDFLSQKEQAKHVMNSQRKSLICNSLDSSARPSKSVCKQILKAMINGLVEHRCSPILFSMVVS